MAASVQFRIEKENLPVSCLKPKDSSMIGSLFYMGVKLSLSSYEEECRLRVLEIKVCLLRRILELRGDLRGGWSKSYNEVLHNFSSPNIIRMMKLRRMKLAGHVARRGRCEIRTKY
jgi:hypothetical protein